MINKKLLCVTALALGLACSTPSLAQTASPPEEDDSIVTDRPDFTESSETVPYKHTQVEVGYTATHTDTTTLHTLGEVLIRIGVKPKTELRLGFNSIAFLNTPGGNTSGFQDFTFGAKWKWCEAAKGYGLHRPQVALITALTVPSGSSVFHEHNAQPLVKLCLGWELAPKWEMGVNFNYSNVSQSGDRFDQFASSVTFGYTWSKHISTFYEIFGFIPGGYQMGNNTYVDTGVAYLLDKNTQLDARVGYGLNGVHNDYFVGVGFAKRF